MFRFDKVYYRIPDLLLLAYISFPWIITCQHLVQAGTTVSHVSWCLKHVIINYIQYVNSNHRGDIHTTISIILLKHATFHAKYKRLKSPSHASNWLVHSQLVHAMDPAKYVS